MADAPKTIGDWDFNQRIIANMDARKFATAKTFMIAAGPPDFTSVTATNVSPLGLLQQVSVSSQIQLFRLFEVGSREPYFATGRDNNRLTLNRVMYNGPSLMKLLYQNAGVAFPSDVPLHTQPGANEASLLYWNLRSIYFEQPIGLLIRVEAFVQDKSTAAQTTGTGKFNQGDLIGSIYLEECYIDSHQVAADANNVLLAENVGLQWTQVVPVA